MKGVGTATLYIARPSLSCLEGAGAHGASAGKYRFTDMSERPCPSPPLSLLGRKQRRKLKPPLFGASPPLHCSSLQLLDQEMCLVPPGFLCFCFFYHHQRRLCNLWFLTFEMRCQATPRAIHIYFTIVSWFLYRTTKFRDFIRL